MSVEISELIEAFRNGPSQLSKSVAGLTESQLDAVPVAGKWSVRQVVCHLVDADLEYSQRIKRVLVEDNPTLQELVPDAYAQSLNYESRGVEEELRLLKAVRVQMAGILQNCDIEDFQRTGVHSAEGPMTLETLLERITGHIDHHLRFIEEKKQAMGVA